MRYILLIAASCLIFGCMSSLVTVKNQPSEYQNFTGEKLALVTITDKRAPGVAASTREAAFGTPMGNITFNPPEAEQVKTFLEVELTKLMKAKGLSSRKEYSCEIIEFGVNTKATVLYWDVIGSIQLVLKGGNKEYKLIGTGTDRTYVWPGDKIITKVINESFNQMIPELNQVAADM
jgi:hypothetical protein